MFKLSHNSVCLAVLFALCALPLVVNAVKTMDEADFEKVPVILKAKDLLPKEMLEGEHHTIEDKVTNNGIFNTYNIYSAFGNATVYNEEQLAARIDEINACAIAELMENYHRYLEKVEEIIMVSGNPFMRKKNGFVVMVVPNDYAVWTKMFSIITNQFYEGLEKQGIKGKKELWFMRKVTPKAKQELQKIGWVVKAEVGDLIPPEEKERLEKERSANVALAQRKGKNELAEKEKEQLKKEKE